MQFTLSPNALAAMMAPSPAEQRMMELLLDSANEAKYTAAKSILDQDMLERPERATFLISLLIAAHTPEWGFDLIRHMETTTAQQDRQPPNYEALFPSDKELELPQDSKILGSPQVKSGGLRRRWWSLKRPTK